MRFILVKILWFVVIDCESQSKVNELFEICRAGRRARNSV